MLAQEAELLEEERRRADPVQLDTCCKRMCLLHEATGLACLVGLFNIDSLDDALLGSVSIVGLSVLHRKLTKNAVAFDSVKLKPGNVPGLRLSKLITSLTDRCMG